MAGAKIYSGAASNVIREAKGAKPPAGAYKSGGSVDDTDDDGRKKGGRVEKHHGKAPMTVHGKKPEHHRFDRPGRKRGGGVGADCSPLTSAAKLKPAEGGRISEDG